MLEPELETESSYPDTVAIFVKPSEDPKMEPVDVGGAITATPYADLGYSHQSAAVYGDYAFFVRDGRYAIMLFDMSRKAKLYTLAMKGKNQIIYHCNQSTFGVDKYAPEDFFPVVVHQPEASFGAALLYGGISDHPAFQCGQYGDACFPCRVGPGNLFPSDVQGEFHGECELCH